MKKKKISTDGFTVEACALRAAGHTYSEIARLLNIPPGSVWNCCRHIAHPVPPRGRFSPSDIAAARALRRAGKTYLQIASALGYTAPAVYYHCRDIAHPSNWYASETP